MGAAVAFALALSAPSAFADDPPPVHVHDGVHASFGMGVVAQHDYATLVGGDGAPRAALGATLAGEVGFALRPGIFLGGACTMFGWRSYTTVGGLALEVYPDPKAGLHFGGAFGLAALRMEETVTVWTPTGVFGLSTPTDVERDATLWGLGLTPHVGIERWVGDRTSLGVTFELGVARVFGATWRGDETHTLIAPMLRLEFSGN